MDYKPAGNYDRPLQHLVRTTTTDAYNGTSYTFSTDANANVYFGSVMQSGSTEIDVAGRILTKTTATIKVRNWYVSISPLDRLIDLTFNETYIVDSVARGNDEYILEAHHL